MTNLYHVRFVRGVASGQGPGVPVTPPLGDNCFMSL